MKKLSYLTANEIIESANENMVLLPSQEEFRTKVATILSMHSAKIQAMETQNLRFNQLPSNSAFVIAPTGTGKSYIMKSLAAASKMNIAFINSTQLTKSGYKGTNVAEALSNIFDNDEKFFTKGNIIVFDEYDKVFNNPRTEEFTASVQPDVLKLFEGGDYQFANGKKINLDKTLIFLAGACTDIISLLKSKTTTTTATRTIGFCADIEKADEVIESDSKLIEGVTITTLIEFGMLKELGSRVNTVLHIDSLTKEDFATLITDKSKVSVTNQFKNLFNARGCSLSISKKAVDKIAEECIERNVGLRSVSAVINEQLIPAFNYLDFNIEYNKAVLSVDDKNNFRLTYYKGKRSFVQNIPEAPKIINFREYNISNEIKSNEKMHGFCNELISLGNEIHDKEYDYGSLIYVFLQCAFRYMNALQEPKNRTFETLLVLANATQKNPLGSSSFISMCEEITNDVYDAVFEHYITIFKLSHAEFMDSATIKAFVSLSCELYFKEKQKQRLKQTQKE